MLHSVIPVIRYDGWDGVPEVYELLVKPPSCPSSRQFHQRNTTDFERENLWCYYFDNRSVVFESNTTDFDNRFGLCFVDDPIHLCQQDLFALKTSLGAVSMYLSEACIAPNQCATKQPFWNLQGVFRCASIS